MRWLPLLLLALAARQSPAQNPDYSNYGTLRIVSLGSAPFPHPARAQGHKYQDQIYPAAKHYQDSSVAYFVPRGFRETDRVDLIVHFHGWHNHVEKVLRQFRLIEQLAESGRNAILVLPQGPRDAPDSFGGKLEDPEGFRRFVDEFFDQLRKDSVLKKKDSHPGRVILSGHSGGYHVIAAILDHGGLPEHLEEVWLFDGLYGQLDKFLAWTELKRGRFINVYTAKGGTADETEQMLKSLTEQGRHILKANEGEVGWSELRTNRLNFLFSTLGHDQVIEARRTFKILLESSSLEPLITGSGK